jgi:polyketide cyclase/dehydrase/lipid transport protein
MPSGSHSIEIGASCEAVFDAVHDYEHRLDWDSMLSQARLLAGATAADVGVRSRCVGTWKGGFLAVETEYVTCRRGRVAAVKLTNRPAFFDSFAATIKHEPLGEARSRTTYIYSFRARPRVLAPLLEPVMQRMFAREVRNRLRSLRIFLEHNGGGGATGA